MSVDETPIERGMKDHFERLGEEHVRLDILTHQYLPDIQTAASSWLVMKDRVARVRNDASQSLQAGIALSTKKAAWIAAIAALFAAVLTIISVVLAWLTWWHQNQ